MDTRQNFEKINGEIAEKFREILPKIDRKKKLNLLFIKHALQRESLFVNVAPGEDIDDRDCPDVFKD
jgi:hypothetical protein